jgi:hypothetical protein
MASFLVESYQPKRVDPAPAELVARLGVAARALALEVQYREAIFLPDDELCLYRFEAASAGAVEQVCERAALRYERVLEALP